MKMKKYQLLCACVAFVGAMALGFALFTGDQESLPLIYVCSGVTLAGLIGNAVCAFLQLDGQHRP